MFSMEILRKSIFKFFTISAFSLFSYQTSTATAWDDIKKNIQRVPSFLKIKSTIRDCQEILEKRYTQDRANMVYQKFIGLNFQIKDLQKTLKKCKINIPELSDTLNQESYILDEILEIEKNEFWNTSKTFIEKISSDITSAHETASKYLEQLQKKESNKTKKSKFQSIKEFAKKKKKEIILASLLCGAGGAAIASWYFGVPETISDFLQTKEFIMRTLPEEVLSLEDWDSKLKIVLNTAKTYEEMLQNYATFLKEYCSINRCNLSS